MMLFNIQYFLFFLLIVNIYYIYKKIINICYIYQSIIININYNNSNIKK